MTCEDKAVAFKKAMQVVTDDFRKGLADTASNVEKKAAEIADRATDGSDLAQGIGGAAGTVIGGYVGGPAGAVFGATVGKAIGALFVIEFTEVIHTASMDIPQITVEDTEVRFDVPEINLQDNDIIFNLPTLVMKTVAGPDQPVPVCTTERQCVGYRIPSPFGDIKDEKCTDVPVCKIEMRPTYFDTPTWEDREQRIVVGLPAITMHTQRFVLGLPEIAMKRTDIKFNLPSITVKFMQDAGKATASAVQALQSDTQSEFARKKLLFRERLRLETVPIAIEMFDCYKQQIRSGISQIASMFDPQISQVSDSLKQLRARGVPEADDDYQRVKAQIDKLIADRALSMSSLEDALSKLEKSATEAIDRLVNEDFEPA
jgi:ElaB/YqjD/DUF883 family membrane-anchored ribosome-binding protein